MSCLLVVIGPTCVVNHSWRNNGSAGGLKNGGLYKYLSRINVGCMSVLFWSGIFIRRERPIRIQIPVQNININIIFALLMDPNGGHHK